MNDIIVSEAWHRFLGALEEAGEVINGPLGATNERESAEGVRHLTRALSIALEMIVEKGDPSRPQLTSWMNPHRKILGDNPGTVYDAALVDPAYEYRITGHVGETTYLGLCVYGTATSGARRIVANLDDHEIVRPDGSFEVHLAAHRPDHLPDEAPFLPLDPDATDILIRQYFHTPGTSAPAAYTVEPVPDHGPPPPLTGEELASRLDRAGRWVRDLVEVEATVSALTASMAPESIRPQVAHTTRTHPDIDWDVVAKAMPTPAIEYAGAWFEDLEDDEAVIIEGWLPECRYASVQWLNRWMESGDYAHHTVALTDHDLEPLPDGSFRIVIAHRDPGVANWLDTTGIRSGNAVVRALAATEPPKLQFRRALLPL
jgi:hypothetical protein